MAIRSPKPYGFERTATKMATFWSTDCHVGLRPPRNDTTFWTRSGAAAPEVLSSCPSGHPPIPSPGGHPRVASLAPSGQFTSGWPEGPGVRVGATLAVVPDPRHACRGGLPQGQPLRGDSRVECRMVKRPQDNQTEGRRQAHRPTMNAVPRFHCHEKDARRDTRPRVSANFPARTPDTPGGVSLHCGKIVFGKPPLPSTAVLPRCMQVCTGIFHKTPQLYLCIHPKFSCKTPIFLKKGNNCAILYARILESFPNCHHS